MRSKKMEKNLEVKIAYKIWSQLNQLDSILWDRYRDEFLKLPIEKDENDCTEDDNQDVDDLFWTVDNVMDWYDPFYQPMAKIILPDQTL